MPTTCGFPNCKFRSRYRGSDDNRHFYRVPKKPAVLRNKWLDAIGRTEQTIVSQLRVCSGHFHSGEKREGDVPVADPEQDAAVKVDLPPKIPRSAAARQNKRLKSLLYQSKSPNESDSIKRRKSVSEDSLSSCSPSVPCPSYTLERRPQSITPLTHSLNLINSRVPTSFPARPLVALLDSRDCTVELPILKDLALVAFCDARKSNELHDKVFREATAVLLWNEIKLNWDDLQKFSNLKVIVKLGAGHDNVDIRAATEMGIAVSVISASCIEEMADSTMCLILGLYRRLFRELSFLNKAHRLPSPTEELDCQVTCQNFPRVRGQVLGLIGLDQVGVAVAVRAKVFGFSVLVYDPDLTQGTDLSLGINRASSLRELLERANCISVHRTAGNDAQQQVINESAFKYIKPGTFLVNISSPKAIDEEALATALTTGQLAAAALDCYELDHINSTQSPLKDCPNLVSTPRVSLFSSQCVNELREKAAEETRQALLGPLPACLPNCVNKEQLLSRIRKSFGLLEDNPMGETDVCLFSFNALANAFLVGH